MHENVFLEAHCQENLRSLSETSLRVISHCATFSMDFTHRFLNKIKNRKI